MALSANVRVTPGMPAADDLIEIAWQGVLNHSKPNQGMSSLLEPAIDLTILSNPAEHVKHTNSSVFLSHLSCPKLGPANLLLTPRQNCYQGEPICKPAYTESVA